MINIIKKSIGIVTILLFMHAPANAGWLDAVAGVKLVDGNGNLQKQQRVVSGFHEINLFLPVRVELYQGNIEHVEVDADENLQSLIDTVVENGALQIRPAQKRTYPQMKHVLIKIYFRNLSEMRISDAGKVSAAVLDTPSFRLNIGGSGSVQIQNLRTEKLETRIGGSGNLSAVGVATQIDATIGGSGSLLLDKLEASDVKVKIGGSGHVSTWAKNNLNVKIGGSGEVRYLGNPQISQSIGGSGKIVRMDM